MPISKFFPYVVLFCMLALNKTPHIGSSVGEWIRAVLSTPHSTTGVLFNSNVLSSDVLANCPLPCRKREVSAPPMSVENAKLLRNLQQYFAGTAQQESSTAPPPGSTTASPSKTFLVVTQIEDFAPSGYLNCLQGMLTDLFTVGKYHGDLAILARETDTERAKTFSADWGAILVPTQDWWDRDGRIAKSLSGTKQLDEQGGRTGRLARFRKWTILLNPFFRNYDYLMVLDADVHFHGPLVDDIADGITQNWISPLWLRYVKRINIVQDRPVFQGIALRENGPAFNEKFDHLWAAEFGGWADLKERERSAFEKRVPNRYLFGRGGACAIFLETRILQPPDYYREELFSFFWDYRDILHGEQALWHVFFPELATFPGRSARHISDKQCFELDWLRGRKNVSHFDVLQNAVVPSPELPGMRIIFAERRTRAVAIRHGRRVPEVKTSKEASSEDEIEKTSTGEIVGTVNASGGSLRGV